MALISANLFLELVGGLGLEGHSVGIKDGLGHVPNLGPFNDVHFNVVLGVFRASEGSGTSFLLLHVKLLDLSFHPVHLHGNLLRLVAVVLETDGDGAHVGECCRWRSASGRQTPQAWHLQSPCQSSSQRCS